MRTEHVLSLRGFRCLVHVYSLTLIIVANFLSGIHCVMFSPKGRAVLKDAFTQGCTRAVCRAIRRAVRRAVVKLFIETIIRLPNILVLHVSSRAPDKALNRALSRASLGAFTKLCAELL